MLNRRTLLQHATLGAASAGLAALVTPQVAAADDIRLLVRADDMGAAQAVNEACIRSCTQGIARSVEVIAPGPWFLDAVRLLKESPGIDVGVHLDLTSEWERVKWGPLTHAPSLVDENGYFFPTTRQRKDFPPNTALLDAKYRLEEVEQELRAQIEQVKRHLPGRVSHVSSHMGAATATPELRALTTKLAKEHGLGMEYPQLKGFGNWSGSQLSAEEKEQNLVQRLEELTAGDWLTVEHPGLDTPEMRNIFHRGYETVAADRAGVTHAFTSAKVKDVIAKRRIKLISYADVTSR
jgi:predicted glycoside hydrolase/deacetylase ChbG (UPF0249 family)